MMQSCAKNSIKTSQRVHPPRSANPHVPPKSPHYRQLPGLKEYALVDVARRSCDVFRKHEDGPWVLHPFEPHKGVTLAGVNLHITPEALWAEVGTTPPHNPNK
jgi:hypothetical protein